MSFAFSQFVIFSCFTVNLLMGRVMTSPVVRQRRSDDPSPLEAVVEQLSQQFNTLNAEVAALKTKTDILDKTVAFHAWSSFDQVRATNHGTIILNHAATNIGNAYDTLTGVFTAPVSGLYDFQASIMSYGPGSGVYTHASINVDDDVVAFALSDSQHGHYSQAAVKAIVHVNVGQKVYLKNPDNKVSEYADALGRPFTTFSGFLIKAD